MDLLVKKNVPRPAGGGSRKAGKLSTPRLPQG